MNTNLFKYAQLGPDAIAYMRECLLRGRTLAKFLVLRPDLDHGTILVPVPPSITQDQIKNFRHGPLLPQPTSDTPANETGIRVVPVPNTNSILEHLIRDYIGQNRQRMCVFEEELAIASDPYVKNLKLKMLTFNEEVYYPLFSTNNSEAAVRRVIRQAANPHPGLIGVATTIDGEDFSVRRGRITKDGLKRIADQAEKIILGAYHGEGYLIWHKPQKGK